MKNLIFVVLCFFGGCVASVPEYESPTLLLPVSGASFSENIFFEWLPNNKADHTTADYIFTLDVSANLSFSKIVYSHRAKVWNTHDASLYHIRNGVYYWRVVATYKQSPSGETVIKTSLPMSFIYTGNDGAIFVDSATAISGNGTQISPVKTISDAFSASGRRQVKQIRVANGTYSGQITNWFLGEIKACYSPVSWTRDTATCATSASFTTEAIAKYDPFN